MVSKAYQGADATDVSMRICKLPAVAQILLVVCALPGNSGAQAPTGPFRGYEPFNGTPQSYQGTPYRQAVCASPIHLRSSLCRAMLRSSVCELVCVCVQRRPGSCKASKRCGFELARWLLDSQVCSFEPEHRCGVPGLITGGQIICNMHFRTMS